VTTTAIDHRVETPSARETAAIPAHPKLLSLIVFALSVVGVSAGAWEALGVHAVIVLVVLGLARVPIGRILRGLTFALPFVVFAVVTPLVALGPRTEVLGVSVSSPAVDAALLMIAKIVIALLASIAFSATSSAQELLLAFDRLRMPPTLTAIISFMIRYAVIVGDDVKRMRIARQSRGGQDHRVAHFRAIASSVGTLFIRSYERGERVHLAMLARAYDGVFPAAAGRPASVAEWAVALSPAVLALIVTIASHLVGS